MGVKGRVKGKVAGAEGAEPEVGNLSREGVLLLAVGVSKSTDGSRFSKYPSYLFKDDISVKTVQQRQLRASSSSNARFSFGSSALEFVTV